MIGLVIATSVDSHGMLSASRKFKPSGCFVRLVRCYHPDIIGLTPEDLHKKDPVIYGTHYVKPLQDSLFKSIMDDVKVRKSFLRTFTKLDVTGSEKLDGSMQPINTYQGLRKIFKRANLSAFTKDLKDRQFDVLVNGTRNDRLCDFVRDMISSSALIKQAISHKPKQGQLDLNCQLSSGEYAIVEVQIDPEAYWDFRAFFYASNAFIHGIKAGKDYHELNRVIAINFLERGYSVPGDDGSDSDDSDDSDDSGLILKTIPWGDNDHYRRHYQFVDREDASGSRILHTIDLIQINLSLILDSELDGLDREEREWIVFLKDAQNHTPEYVRKHIQFPAVQQAYKLSSYNRIPDRIILGIEEERSSGILSKATEHNLKMIERKEGRKEGRKEEKFEIAKKMLLAGMDRGNIIEFTGLSEEELDSLSKKD